MIKRVVEEDIEELHGIQCVDEQGCFFYREVKNIRSIIPLGNCMKGLLVVGQVQ